MYSIYIYINEYIFPVYNILITEALEIGIVFSYYNHEYDHYYSTILSVNFA